MAPVRRTVLSLCVGVLVCMPAFASDWTMPTPQQLKMTSDSAAPGEAAVYLYREETVDDKEHFHKVFAEVKILTEKGKEEFSNIVIPYEQGEADQNVVGVSGRTIEPDGRVVAFTGKPYRKQLMSSGNERLMETAFSMPDVQVGSVLEYQYTLDYDEDYLIPPVWMLQHKVFTHQEHYHFQAADDMLNVMVKDAMGHENAVNHLIYFQDVPAGVRVESGVNGYDLVVNNIPALANEPYMPPVNSYSYRVIFYYSPYNSGTEFWKVEGRYWSKDADKFEDAGALRAAVGKITAPGDTEVQKLQKIYAAVMTVENTDYSRTPSAAENKADQVKIKNAAGVWEYKQGTSNQITRLFLGMARAAGLKAYDMIVTERDQSILNLGYLNWGQLSDEIAIVNVGGKEEYFDPGERYCEFGKLDWEHQLMMGIRQIDGGTKVAMVPAGAYPDNQVTRTADLTLSPDGEVQGRIEVIMNGQEALYWRQFVLSHDLVAAKKAFEKELQARVPAGVHVAMDHFLSLTDSSSYLMAIVNVSGTMGTATGKMLFVPAAFFEANVQPKFSAQQRTNPIDLHYPYENHDQVTVTLGPGLKVESLPKSETIPYPQTAEYQQQFGAKGNQYEEVRLLANAKSVFQATDYPKLRSFYQGVAAQDQQQVVLQKVPVPVPAAAKGE